MQKKWIQVPVIAVVFMLAFLAVFLVGLPKPWRSFHYYVIGQPNVFYSNFEQLYSKGDPDNDEPYFMIRLQATGEHQYFGESPFQVRIAAFTEFKEGVDWSVEELSILRANGDAMCVNISSERAVDNTLTGREIIVSPSFRMYRFGVWESGYLIDLDESADVSIYVLAKIKIKKEGVSIIRDVQREFRSEVRSGMFQPRE